MELIDCPDLKSLFTDRNIAYQIRNRRPIRENSHATNYTFNSPIARLRRVWNSLPQNLLSIQAISVFKRTIRLMCSAD